MRGIRFLHSLFIAPNSETEDSRRKEFVLNIILVASIFLLLILGILLIISSFKYGAGYVGFPAVILLCFILVFGGLLVLSRKGFVLLASYSLLGIYFLLTMYGVITWSYVLPMIILGSIIIIVVSSILISTRFSFFITLVIGLCIAGITFFQIRELIPVQLYWRDEPLRIKDTLEMSIIFILISAISWLSNRETEKSLRRARASEDALVEERNNLEITVEERTRELKASQAEQVAQLYRFAEFGKLSSGIFHDLMNPLNAVIANVGQIETKEDLPEVKQYLEKAVAASRRMGDFLGTVRKQIKPSLTEEVFSPNKELQEAVDILQYKARVSHVTIKIRAPKELTLFGNPLKFHQIALNLISNAIDAYDAVTRDQKIIHVSLLKKDHSIVLKVTDQGCGIPEELKQRVFEQFFTTKGTTKGIGLGLSTTKTYIEKDFNGTLGVTSNPDGGTSFSATFIPVTH